MVKLSIGLLLVLQVALVTYIQKWEAAEVEVPVVGQGRLDTEVVKTASFGHLPAVVDWLLIRTLLDSSHYRDFKGAHPPSYYDLDLATDLDPAYYHLYLVGAELLSVIRDDATGARDLLLKGTRYGKEVLPSQGSEFERRFWSRQWDLYLHLGYVYLFELDDLPSAAEAFLTAGKFSGAPPYLDRLSRRLEKPEGKYEVGLRLLTFMIQGESDAEVRARLGKKRVSLFMSQYLFLLNEQFRSFLSKDEKYRRSLQIGSKEMERYFTEFMKESRTPSQDPWGGTIILDRESSKVSSTTPREPIMGLF